MERNASRQVTGEDTKTWKTIAWLLCGALVGLFWWEYQARTVVGFNANYSSPSDIYAAAKIWWWIDLRKTGITALRGVVAIAIAFFVAYPLGSYAAMVAKLTKSFVFTNMFGLVIPKLVVIFIILRVVGFNSLSVMIISIWTASLMMAALGSFH